MKGRVGQTTYYISKGQQVARQSRNDSNYGETARRTLSQQQRRVLWSNLVEFYKISAGWMPKAFETKSSGQTDYNKFMAINVPTARIPITKSQAEAGGCVIDAFVISQGSLPSVEVTQLTDGWKTNLMIGSLVIGANTTVGELSVALISNNANCREGMQLSFASYQQSVDPLGVPHANCRLYELTISQSDTSLVRDHIPAIGCSSVDNAIGTSGEMPQGGFAWIMSELVNGQLKVSTQLITTNNAQLLAQYMTSTQLDAAIASYGLDTEVVLNPTTIVAQAVEPSQAYIQWIEVGGDRYTPGSYVGSAAPFYNATVTIKFSDSVADLITTIVLTGENGGNYTDVNGRDIVRSSDRCTCQFSVAQGSGLTVRQITVTLTTGTVLNIQFMSGDMG